MHSRATYNRLDAGLVRIEGSYIPRLATNGIKVSYGTNNTSELFDNKFIGWKRMSKGMAVCKTGITTNKTCGTVFSVNQVMEIEGVLYNMSLVLSDDGRAFGDQGDSGGAVYQVAGTGNYLTGILSGRIGANNQYGLVVDVLSVRDNYGISLYTSNTNTSIN